MGLSDVTEMDILSGEYRQRNGSRVLISIVLFVTHRKGPRNQYAGTSAENLDAALRVALER